MRLRSLLAFATISTIVVLGQGLSAQAAEIRVIAANPVKGVLEELAKQFEANTGHKLVATFGSSPVLKRQIDAGAPFDLAVFVAPVLDDLIKEGKLVAATRADVATAGVGVGVRAGAPKPDISSVEAFKRALLNAKSVAHSAEGASGVYFKQLLERLGIADEMKAKLKPSATPALAVPSGEAEMVVVTASAIVGSETQLVGLLPSELQTYLRFSAAVGSNAKEVEGARALLNLLTSESAVPVIKAKGMEPAAAR